MKNELDFSEKSIEKLRREVAKNISGKRLSHILSVESEAVFLGAIYAKDKIPELRAAALLHDITKEITPEEQYKILNSYGLEPTRLERSAYKTLHAKTAALIIPDKYPRFASKTVIGAVRYHTVGRPNMNICEKILFLADYIEATRTFGDCIKLRKYFYDRLDKAKTTKEKNELLAKTLLLAFDMTIEDLIKDGKIVAPQTVASRNSLLYNSEN